MIREKASYYSASLRSVLCAIAVLWAAPAAAITIDVSFGQSVGAGSPSVYTLSNTFTLPTGFSNASLSITSLSIDDRGILSLNGTQISDAGIFGPGAGSLTLSLGGPNNAYTYLHGNGAQSVTVTSGFLTGLNTLEILVNDTNSGIFGEPLASGVNISSAFLAASVSYDDEAVVGVPEPGTIGLLGFGVLILAEIRRRKSKQLAA